MLGRYISLSVFVSSLVLSGIWAWKSAHAPGLLDSCRETFEAFKSKDSRFLYDRLQVREKEEFNWTYDRFKAFLDKMVWPAYSGCTFDASTLEYVVADGAEPIIEYTVLLPDGRKHRAIWAMWPSDEGIVTVSSHFLAQSWAIQYLRSHPELRHVDLTVAVLDGMKRDSKQLAAMGPWGLNYDDRTEVTVPWDMAIRSYEGQVEFARRRLEGSSQAGDASHVH